MDWEDKFINRVVQGDVYQELKELPDRCIDLIVVDPPYNLHKFDYGNLSDFQKQSKYEDWCRIWIKELVRILKLTGSLYCWSSHQQVGFLQTEFNKILIYQNMIIWKVQGQRYRREKNFSNKYELCLFYTKSNNYIFNKEKYHIPLGVEQLLNSKSMVKSNPFYKKNKQKAVSYYKRLIAQGRMVTNIWDDIDARKSHITNHLNEKPVKLIDRCILMSSKEDDLVLDCFAGSFTTAVSCEKNKRKWINIELEKYHCESGRERLANLKVNLSQKSS